MPEPSQSWKSSESQEIKAKKPWKPTTSFLTRLKQINPTQTRPTPQVHFSFDRSKASRAYYNTTLIFMSPFVRRGTFSDKSDNISFLYSTQSHFGIFENKLNYLGWFGKIIKLFAKHTATWLMKIWEVGNSFTWFAHMMRHIYLAPSCLFLSPGRIE